MKIAVTHRLDDPYIEKAWKHAETEEIENLAAELLGKAQEAQSIEDDLFCISTLLSDAASKRPLGNNRVSKTIDTVCSRRSAPYGDDLDNLSALRANEPALRFWIEPQDQKCGPDRSQYC